MAVSRDINREKLALKQYQGIYKKNPTSTDDWAKLHALAYPGGQLPDEFKAASDASAGAAGLTTPTNPPLGQTVATSNLGQLADNVTNAQTAVDNTSQPNEALRVLQEAIRTKSGNAQQPLGTSDVFKQAGLTGMGSLNASLAETNNKFVDDMSNFKNIIGQMSGTYKDMATAASSKYDNAYTAYKDEVDRLQKIQDDLNAHKDAIDTMNLQYQNSIKLAAYNKSLDVNNPSVDDIIKAETGGLENVGGSWLSKNRNTITSPSGNSYDWSTYNAVGTPAQQAAYIKSVQNAISNVGKIDSDEKLNNYIATKMAGSNITASDIKNVAGKMGVGYEEMLGLLQKESEGGTSNVALKNNNFGGITWTPTYQASHPNVTKGSARPASEGGNYVKFATVQDGLEAQAQQFTRRAISSVGVDGADITVDPSNQSILAQTGLSVPAFSFLTKGTAALTRMSEKSRKQYMTEAEDYLNKNGVDLSTFQSQYSALGKTVEANSLRNNQAGVAESELDATLQNLATAADEADFKKLRATNVAKLFAGKEVNDPAVLKYAFHLQQLREEFAMYNAAIGGQIDANGNIRQINDADYARAEAIIKDGIAKGGIDGFKNALTASRDKMKTVLENSIDAQNKQVWKLFGVEDKYTNKTAAPTGTPVVSSGTASSGNKFTVTKE